MTVDPRPTLSSWDSSFQQYKDYADIHEGFLEKTAVGRKRRFLMLSVDISSKLLEIKPIII